MEQPKNRGGEDDAATDKEEAKAVRKKAQTEDEVETPTGSALRAAVNPHVTPTSPRKEKRKDAEKKKEHHPLKGTSSSTPKILGQDTFTAWEKKRPSKGPGSRPPRFSRLLSSLSEEQTISQQKEELPMEPPEEELENLVRRSSLQEHPSGQDKRIPVNFSAHSLPEPQEIPAVETVETEPKGLEDLVASTSGHAEEPTVPPASSSIELKKEDSSCAPFRRLATVHSVHSKVLVLEDSASSIPGEFQVRKDTLPIVWNMGQRVSQWKQAHQRGYHIDQLTQDKTLKSTILKHERDTKAAVPLPLQEVIEEEVLEILKETLKDYRKYLGADHNLTLQLEEQAEKLHLRLKGRGVID